jgi:hypothetical protein
LSVIAIYHLEGGGPAMRVRKTWECLVSVGLVYRRGVLPAVRALRQSIRIESHYEIVAAGNRRDADSAGERTPFAQQVNVLGDVQFLELTTVFREPILGRFAVRSRGRGVDFDFLHGVIVPLQLGGYR